MVGATGLEPAILPLPKRALYQAELRPDAMPSQLLDRLSPMAICAADFTLRDFQKYPLPRPTLPNQITYVSIFFATDVVELQNARIGFSAIHTRMRRQILGDISAVTYAVSGHIDQTVCLGTAVVSMVIRRAVLPSTFLTETAITVASQHRWRKSIQG